MPAKTMTARFFFIWVLLGIHSVSALNCRSTYRNFVRGSLGKLFPSFRSFQNKVREVVENRFLDDEAILHYYRQLAERPHLISLMRGLTVSNPENEIVVSAGWGEDLNFVPATGLWNDVISGLPTIATTYSRKLGLPNDFLFDLIHGDQISIADSGWVIVTKSPKRKWYKPWESPKTRAATVKISLFDENTNPNGVWPRYAMTSASQLGVNPATDPADFGAADMVDGIQVKSSLTSWGLLPLEQSTGYRIKEHRPETYQSSRASNYPNLFSQRFTIEHWLQMDAVIRARGDAKASAKTIEALKAFRKKNLPPKALRVAEIGRFTIPPELGPQGKAHVLYGLLALIRDKPIDRLYLEAPKVPGDLLRKTYERDYGFTVEHSFEAAPETGSAIAGHVMSISKDQLMENLSRLLAEGQLSKYLTEEQLAFVKGIHP